MYFANGCKNKEPLSTISYLTTSSSGIGQYQRILHNEHLHKSVSDDVFLENFEDNLLDILNSFTGNLVHHLEDYEFLNTVDWQWMFDAAKNRFKEGKQQTTIFVGANGQLSLGQLDEGLGWKLNDPSEVFIQGQFYASGIATVIKVKWEQLLNHTFKFADLEKKDGYSHNVEFSAEVEDDVELNLVELKPEEKADKEPDEGAAENSAS